MDAEKRRKSRIVLMYANYVIIVMNIVIQIVKHNYEATFAWVVAGFWAYLMFDIWRHSSSLITSYSTLTDDQSKLIDNLFTELRQKDDSKKEARGGVGTVEATDNTTTPGV